MPLPDLSRYEKYADLTTGRMRYVEAGAGDDHLLLVHGMGAATSLETYQWVIGPLARHVHVYALDMLGFGKSTRKMDYGPTFDVIVDGIREFMDVKGISSAYYVGHSAGGWWGGLLAYESPHRLRKLVMVTSAGLDATPVANVSGYSAVTMESVKRQITNYRSVYPGSHLTPELAEELAQQMLAIGTRDGAYEGLKPLVDQMAKPASRRHYLLHRRLPHITVPTMVVWSRPENKEPHPTWTAEWEKTGGDPSKSSKPWVIPGARYVLLPDNGYNPQWETPEKFVQLLLDFFRS